MSTHLLHIGQFEFLPYESICRNKDIHTCSLLRDGKPNRIYHTYEQLGFEVNVILQVADVISIAGCSCCSRQGRVPRKDGAARMSGMI